MRTKRLDGVSLQEQKDVDYFAFKQLLATGLRVFTKYVANLSIILLKVAQLRLKKINLH